jgi:regulator of protease activity HflC (stomatin/prohibitin superfamily)
MVLSYIVMGVLALGGIWASASLRVIKQYERGLVFRFGRVRTVVREPGLTAIMPFADRMRKVNLQVVTMPVPAQDGITRDNVTVKVDAVVYFKVIEPRSSTSRTTGSPSARSRRPRCGRSSARATSTTCCPTARSSTRGWS